MPNGDPCHCGVAHPQTPSHQNTTPAPGVRPQDQPQRHADPFTTVHCSGEGRDSRWHTVEYCPLARGRLRRSRLGAMLASGRPPCTRCTTHLLNPNPHHVNATPWTTTGTPPQAQPPHHDTINPRPDGYRERRHTTLT